MRFSTVIPALLAAGASSTYASPLEARQAVVTTECLDPSVKIDFHDENVAQLQICGGIAGAITKCNGNPASTVGQSGTAKFSLKALEAGSTLNISKGRWERCIKAARAVCPTGSIRATCPLGTTGGDSEFVLDNP